LYQTKSVFLEKIESSVSGIINVDISGTNSEYKLIL
jgi:hypothetical protein